MRYQQQANVFIPYYAGHESWTRIQMSEYVAKAKKFRSQPSLGKVITTLFFYSHDVTLNSKQYGVNINAERYAYAQHQQEEQTSRKHYKWCHSSPCPQNLTISTSQSRLFPVWTTTEMIKKAAVQFERWCRVWCYWMVLLTYNPQISTTVRLMS